MSAVVVGGGAAGCAAAYTLRKLGHDVTLLEAADHLGGRTWTLRREGIAIDTGAGYITTFYDRTLALVRELGHEDSLVELKAPTGFWDGERLHLVRPDSPRATSSSRFSAGTTRSGSVRGRWRSPCARRELGEANYQ